MAATRELGLSDESDVGVWKGSDTARPEESIAAVGGRSGGRSRADWGMEIERLWGYRSREQMEHGDSGRGI